jgi:hypothetical protein
MPQRLPFVRQVELACPGPVTVRHMYVATTALAPDYGGSASPISKGNATGEQGNVYIETTTLLQTLFFSP